MSCGDITRLLSRQRFVQVAVWERYSASNLRNTSLDKMPRLDNHPAWYLDFPPFFVRYGILHEAVQTDIPIKRSWNRMWGRHDIRFESIRAWAFSLTFPTPFRVGCHPIQWHWTPEVPSVCNPIAIANPTTYCSSPLLLSWTFAMHDLLEFYVSIVFGSSAHSTFTNNEKHAAGRGDLRDD